MEQTRKWKPKNANALPTKSKVPLKTEQYERDLKVSSIFDQNKNKKFDIKNVPMDEKQYQTKKKHCHTNHENKLRIQFEHHDDKKEEILKIPEVVMKKLVKDTPHLRKIEAPDLSTLKNKHIVHSQASLITDHDFSTSDILGELESGPFLLSSVDDTPTSSSDEVPQPKQNQPSIITPKRCCSINKQDKEKTETCFNKNNLNEENHYTLMSELSNTVGLPCLDSPKSYTIKSSHFVNPVHLANQTKAVDTLGICNRLNGGEKDVHGKNIKSIELNFSTIKNDAESNSVSDKAAQIIYSELNSKHRIRYSNVVAQTVNSSQHTLDRRKTPSNAERISKCHCCYGALFPSSSCGVHGEKDCQAPNRIFLDFSMAGILRSVADDALRLPRSFASVKQEDSDVSMTSGELLDLIYLNEEKRKRIQHEPNSCFCPSNLRHRK